MQCIHTYSHIHLYLSMAVFQGKLLLRKTTDFLLSLINSTVFFFLDLLDFTLCIFFRYFDEFMEGKSTPCYCRSQNGRNDSEKRSSEISDTLFGRKNVVRELSFLGNWTWEFGGTRKSRSKDLGKNRWSDCGCDSCVSWMDNGGGQKLHVVVKDPSTKGIQDSLTKNVIFLHGFMSSSYLWTERVFPQLVDTKYRLFAVDLLGYGNSPKPRECLYTLNDHMEMIEKSVIHEFNLSSFHLVAHSMGCIIALALAAKYPNNLKSITLVAPPYFLSSEEEDASEVALKRLAGKSVWPPLLFGSALMTWYEHLGRCVCFVMCRNHRTWERILKLITRKKKLSFLVMDLFRHTHHSAWHTMHNVICGGAKMMDPCLEKLREVGARVTVFQGSRDQIVPVECSSNVKVMVPDAEVKIIKDANHNTVILGREKQFAAELKLIWDSVTDAEVL